MPRLNVGLLLAGVFILATTPFAQADIKLPGVFSDHMVLQRDQALPVWGTASPGEMITVAIDGQTQATKAVDDGKWMTKLKPLKAGGPHVLSIRGNNAIEIKDVLVGEVWVGSGQSNMAGGVNGYAKGDALLAELAAGNYPKLRLCRGNGGRWQEATPQNNAGYSALLFAFGQRLQQELGVPVGLIVGAVGGTPSGRWLTEEMLKQDAACQQQIKDASVPRAYEQAVAEYEKAMARWEEQAEAAATTNQKPPKQPEKPLRAGEIRGGKYGDLYLGNIQPVVPYAFRGVLWDQGESGTAIQGVDQFAAMGALIQGWRSAWGQGDFPFLYVQKSSGGGCAWDPNDPVTAKAEPFTKLPAVVNKANGGEYRELHIRIMQHPHAAMVTASDLGSGVHPVNKSGYGHRAARVAFGQVYDRQVATCGPMYQSHQIAGAKVRVKFSHVGQGLAWKHGERLQGFEIAGDDGAFAWADAEIDGDTVVVSSAKVANPVMVRYAWAPSSPWANLFNKDGLPALTFRTAKD